MRVPLGVPFNFGWFAIPVGCRGFDVDDDGTVDILLFREAREIDWDGVIVFQIDVETDVRGEVFAEQVAEVWEVDVVEIIFQ